MDICNTVTPPLLNLLVLRSDDMERAAAFYALLGIVFTKHSHGSGPEHYAAELPGGIIFEIYPRPLPNGDRTRGTRIGFSVADVDAVVEVLLTAGGKILTEAQASPWGRRAVIGDIDGHKIELTQPLNKPE